MLTVEQWQKISTKYGWKDLGGGQLRSGVARLSYANLFVPKAFKGGPNAKPDDKPSVPRYGVTLLLPRGDKATVLVDACHAILKAQYPNATISEPSAGAKPTVRVDYWTGGKAARVNAAWPLIDQGETLGEGYEPGSLMVAAYSKEKRGVVDQGGKLITDPNRVVSGGYAFVALRPYWAKGWDRLSIGLQAVQFLSPGEPLGGGVADPGTFFDDVGSDFAGYGISHADSGAGLGASILD